MHVSTSSLVACAIALLASSPCIAAPESRERLPQPSHFRDSLDASRHEVLVEGFRIGALPFKFEDTRWSDIKQSLPPLRMRRQGDAGGAEVWTCLTVHAHNGTVQVWPSSSELQGGEFIDGVIAQAGVTWPIQDCPAVEFGDGEAALDNGAWIGTTKSDLLKRLGQPSAVRGSTIVYDFDAPLRDHEHGECVVSGRLLFDLHANRVVRLAVNKDTSC